MVHSPFGIFIVGYDLAVGANYGRPPADARLAYCRVRGACTLAYRAADGCGQLCLDCGAGWDFISTQCFWSLSLLW